MNKKVWLVTGTSSGFGRKLVEALLARDYAVVATARKLADIADFNKYDDVLTTTLEVTNHDDVLRVVAEAVDRFGKIDVLVNNAGWGYFGNIEESDETTVRAMFETNFWGLSDMTRAVLPVMREQRSGHILNLTSIAGIVGSPAFGYYNATKHAVEGWSKALAQEVAPLGIKVTNIEPGPFRTDWAGRSHISAERTISDYDGGAAEKHKALTESISGKQTGSPELAALAMIKIATIKNPPLHFLAGQNAWQRAHDQLDKLNADFDTWQGVTNHLDYGDEAYWADF
ncbi:oxidoreductase [Pseudolactococcus insecticola]|uniref:oxidoreductase n=1 Tax=Pseudolactococcus insecticola TaxID=2709158 RepID=UPI001555E9DA|nr:oxidoreductase [Lactococcus insecticola]